MEELENVDIDVIIKASKGLGFDPLLVVNKGPLWVDFYKCLSTFQSYIDYCNKHHFKIQMVRPVKVGSQYMMNAFECFEGIPGIFLFCRTEVRVVNEEAVFFTLLGRDGFDKELFLLSKSFFDHVELKDLERIISSIPEKKYQTYLMFDANSGHYKIGRSIDPKFRERTLQSEKPSISLVGKTKVDIEKRLHDKYSVYHVRGEWYNLSQHQVKDILDLFKSYN